MKYLIKWNILITKTDEVHAIIRYHFVTIKNEDNFVFNDIWTFNVLNKYCYKKQDLSSSLKSCTFCTNCDSFRNTDLQHEGENKKKITFGRIKINI